MKARGWWTLCFLFLLLADDVLARAREREGGKRGGGGNLRGRNGRPARGGREGGRRSPSAGGGRPGTGHVGPGGHPGGRTGGHQGKRPVGHPGQHPGGPRGGHPAGHPEGHPGGRGGNFGRHPGGPQGGHPGSHSGPGRRTGEPGRTGFRSSGRGIGRGVKPNVGRFGGATNVWRSNDANSRGGIGGKGGRGRSFSGRADWDASRGSRRGFGSRTGLGNPGFSSGLQPGNSAALGLLGLAGLAGVAGMAGMAGLGGLGGMAPGGFQYGYNPYYSYYSGNGYGGYGYGYSPMWSTAMSAVPAVPQQPESVPVINENGCSQQLVDALDGIPRYYCDCGDGVPSYQFNICTPQPILRH